jgi:hypothetical protein
MSPRFSTRRRTGRRIPAAAGLTALVAALLLAAAPAPAWAHGDEESMPAYDLVRQAIALIVNTPDDHEAIEDKVNDALEAEDTSQVKLPLVEQAKEAFEADDMHQVRSKLEAAIGARVHTGDAEPVPIGEPAPVTGEETGTVAAIDALPGRGGLTGGDWVLIAVSALVGLIGIALSVWVRPRVHRPHAAPGR